MAPDRFSISASRDGCRCTLSRSKRSTCLISPDHLDQGRSDQALGEPCRQQPGKDDQDRKTDQQFPDRHLHRSKKFRLRHDRHQRPARKRNRRQHRLIGLSVPRHLGVKRLAFTGIVGAGVLDRIHRDGKQRMIGLQRHHLVGVRIGRGDNLAVPLEDERAGRFSDGKLRQEIRDAGQLDDNGDDAGGLLVDTDRRREGCRQPFAARMRRQRRPMLVVGLDGHPKPFLIGDGIIGVLDPRVLELKIVADEFIAANSHLAIGGDLEHFDDAVAELVPREERPIRPSERHPGNGRLRQELRPEYDFALRGVARVEHFSRPAAYAPPSWTIVPRSSPTAVRRRPRTRSGR